MNQLQQFLKEEEGQGMTEYGLILGVIAVGVIGLLTIFGDRLQNEIRTVTTNIFGP